MANTTSKRKILLLDDDADSVYLLKTRFEAEGCEVATGLDGYEGLLKMRQEIPNLVVLDVLMPKLNGLECFKALKRNPLYAMTPIVILTVRQDLRKTFEELGCDYFAAKPFRVDELMAKCRDLLKKKLLVFGIGEAFRCHIRISFPGHAYRLQFVDYENEFFHELAQNRYHLCIAHLAEVRHSPETFTAQLWDVARNPNVQVLIYCDEQVKEVEDGHPVGIAKLELEWMKAGNVVFYDRRAKGPSLSDFLAEQGILG